MNSSNGDLRRIITQYPYNLLSKVIGGPWDDELTRDNIDGLEMSLKYLSLRERKYIRRFFAEGEEISQIAENEGRSYSSVAIAIDKGINKLRRSWSLDMIKRGLIRYEEEKKEKLILNIEEMELSVRSVNALLRYGIKTLNQLEIFVQANGVDGLLQIRNIGRTTAEEILLKMSQFTGKDYIKIAYEEC